MRQSYQLVTAATQEPVSLAEFKDHVYDLSDEQNATIDQCIAAARRYVEQQTETQLVSATWKLWLDRFPCGDIEIRKCPVQSVSSVNYTDSNGASQTWSSSLYDTDLVSNPARIRPAYSQIYPTTRYGVPNAVSVTFVAGQAVADVDPMAKRAVLLLAAHWFEHREAVSPTSMSEVPKALESLISSLRWTVPV